MSTGTTSDRGYPYPNNDEPVTNGWDAIRDLAEAVDNDVVDTRTMPWAVAEAATDYTHNGGVTLDPLANMGATLTELEEGIAHAAGVFTIPEDGVYEVLGWVRQTPRTAPHNGIKIWFGINGQAQRNPDAYAGDGHLGNNQSLCIQDRMRFTAGNTVRMSGQGIGGQTGVLAARMSVIKVRD